MLVFCVAALLALGMVMLYSSSMVQVGARYLVMQLVWGAIGLVALFAAARIDYHLLRKLAWPSCFGLVSSPRAPSGNRLRQQRSPPVVQLGVIRFQPSELAKLALIVALAWYGERYQRHMGDWKRGSWSRPCLSLLFWG